MVWIELKSKFYFLMTFLSQLSSIIDFDSQLAIGFNSRHMRNFLEVS